MNKIVFSIIAIAIASAGFYKFDQKNNSISAVPLNVVSLHSTWMNKFNKVYSSPEEMTHRLKNFHNSYELVTKHNSDKTQTYTMGLNFFADLDLQEIRAKFLMQDYSAEELNEIESKPRFSAS
jgi:C1A family cysteine protease